MGFDLSTFLAQVINLFLLIWVLKRFLYRPVLDIIDKRRKQIADHIQEAENKLADANKMQQNIIQQQAAFDKNRQQRFDELDKDIQKQKAQMMKELELNYLVKRDKLQNDLNQSWQNAENAIQEMLALQFVNLSQKILQEWFDQSPMDKVLNQFCKKIKSLNKKKKTLVQSLLQQHNTLQIITSETLNNQQKSLIKNCLQEQFNVNPNIRLQYKKRTDIILGIEMRLGNFILDWNLNTYFNELNQKIKQNISSMITPTKRKVEK